jgi:hypothetical protein
MDRYVLLAGSGRSGSNRLLDAFDRHERVVCRSEVFGLKDGEFRRLPQRNFADDVTAGEILGWTAAVDRARGRRSWRDRADILDKTFLRPRALAWIGQSVMGRKRAREMLGRVVPGIGGAEWTLPRLYRDDAALAATTLVMKGVRSGWIVRMHDEDPRMRVLHNLRHPRDYLDSWMNRFVRRAGADPRRAFEHAVAQGEIARMLDHFGVPHDILGTYSEEHLIEQELWLWRFHNEVPYIRLGGSERYRVVTYAGYDADPVGTMREAYAFAGLDFADRHAERIGGMRNTLFARPHAHRLDDALCDRLIDRVLGDSPLMDVFAGAPGVS